MCKSGKTGALCDTLSEGLKRIRRTGGPVFAAGNYFSVIIEVVLANEN
jgi:hypothetical protein